MTQCGSRSFCTMLHSSWRNWHAVVRVLACAWLPRKPRHGHPKHSLSQLITPTSQIVDILLSNDVHLWLGCLASYRGSRAASADVDFHVQVASDALFANTCFLCDRNISSTERLQFFETAISPVAGFACGFLKFSLFCDPFQICMLCKIIVGSI